MADIREAFLRASKSSPTNFLSREIEQSAEEVVRERKEDASYLALSRRYNKLGNIAYQVSMKQFSYQGEDRSEVLRQQWRYLHDRFSNSSPKRKEQLLKAFAEGLRLTSEELDFRYEETLGIALEFTGKDLRRTAESTGFDIRTRIFLNAVHMYEDLNYEQARSVEKGFLRGQTHPLSLQEVIIKIAHAPKTLTSPLSSVFFS